MAPSRFDNSESTPERSPSPPIPSPKRRPSVERLMQRHSVKNSNIFALENKDAYDPSTVPVVERPSANRPLSQQLANNTFARADSLRKENNPFRSPNRSGHKRTESEINIPFFSPTKSPASVPLPRSPEKQDSPSPTKSSLSRTSQFGVSPPNAFDPESGTWSDGEERVPTPRALHRHAKSVTFHEEPPTINEYEQQTPEPSSVASDREGSWDSEDFEDQDISFDRGSSADPDRDDSFDADLENTDKTPVVLPEDWSRMSPDEARTDLANQADDVFEGEESERGTRIASDGSDSRPLPPLPGFISQQRRDSNGLSSVAERAAYTPRSLPSPPKRASCSKDEILNMTRRSSLTLQERLQLMGAQQEERPTSKSSHATESSNPEELTITNLDTGGRVEVQVQVQVTETEVLQEDSIFEDTAPPRISRESILRTVRSSKYEFEDEETFEESEIVGNADSPTRPSIAELARMDPDQPIPSRENSRETSDSFLGDGACAAAYVYAHEPEEATVKEEPMEEDGFDMNDIPSADLAPPRSPSRMDDYDRQSSVLRHGVQDDDDNESRYSSVEPDAESTMIHMREERIVEQHEDGKETLQEAMQLLTVEDYGNSKATEPTKQGSGEEFMGLPAYLGSIDDYDFGMREYITPSPPASTSSEQKLDLESKMPELQPPVDLEPPRAHYVERDVSPPATPESVIHLGDDGEVSPLEEHNGILPATDPVQRDSPEIPERKATIKTNGKLKTRKSGTPADFDTMAEQRRMVSAELPNMPAIPEQYQQAQVEDAVAEAGAEQIGGEETSVYSSERANEMTTTDSQVEEAVAHEKFKKRRKNRKSGGRMDLSLDASALSLGDYEGLGLDEEFEKVIEGQKVRSPIPYPPPLFAASASRDRDRDPQERQQQRFPVSSYYGSASRAPSPFVPHARSAGTDVSTRTQKGYLMRQNTKVVVASNRNVSGSSNDTVKSNDGAPMSPTGRDARPTSSRSGPKSANGGSPRKPSEEHVLKTEPWNGKMRRKSIRNASAQKASYRSEPAPPLPGQESALGVVDEDYATGSSNLDEDVGEGVERGRLFVKVVGVKDLDLPMPRNDRVDFQLTLDNGLHCVTTSDLELGRSAPIGQEFELVVLNDLEFQLTLTTKLPPPPKETQPATPVPSSPTKSLKSQRSAGFSRFLSSPKKRAEKERQEREAAEAEERRLKEEARKKRASQVPRAWDLLHELVNAQDGSFARAYVNLKSHEKSCFGRQLTVDVPCYNEWALEKDSVLVNSVRSKRGTNTGPIRRPPYVVGQLELQLLYVPKPKGAGDEDMPKSMGGAVREMGKASETKEVVHEGHLSQEGGDCIVSPLPKTSLDS